ncbi:MAG: hypothetical protein K8R99_05115 [Actinomycetia bacterium]|nr:hypothetical protein [Actinomycetes bacterium]
MISKRLACVVAMTAALGVLGACSSTKSSGPAETVAPTDSVEATDPPTTPAPTTIEPTTLAPTTTVAARPFLRGDGLGAFDFGASDTDMTAGMSLTVLSDDSSAYPTDFGDGLFLNVAGDYTFQYQSGRSVCWDDGAGNYLCAHFGGADATHLGLVGWEYYTLSGSPTNLGNFYSAVGATINAELSAVAGVPPIAGECYGYSNVFVDDILLDVRTTSGDSFGTYGDDGSYTLVVPQPAATVTYLQAGERPIPYSVDGEGDC